MTLARTAAIGAFLQIAHFIAMIGISVLITTEGIAATSGGLYDPKSGLAYALGSPTLTTFHMVHLLMVFGLIPTVLLFHDRLVDSNRTLVRVAALAGVTAIVLNFLSTLQGLLFQFLKTPAETSLVEAQGAYLAIILISGAFLRGSAFAYGWWLALSSGVALRAGIFSKAFNILGIVVGIASILSLFVTQLDLFGMVGLIWLLWLAINLLREKA